MENHSTCTLQSLEQSIEREGHNLQSTSMYVIQCLDDYVTHTDESLTRELQILRGTFLQMYQCFNSLKQIIKKRLHAPHSPPPRPPTPDTEEDEQRGPEIEREREYVRSF